MDIEKGWRMKGKLILAFILLGVAVLAIVTELVYLKKVSDAFSYQLEQAIDLLSDKRLDESFSVYKDFSEKFLEQEKIISIFVHDKYVDEIRDIIYETDAYFLKEETSDFFEYEDLIRNIEKIKIKIHDIYESMIPDLKNLM